MAGQLDGLIAKLEQTTGRSVDEWDVEVAGSGLERPAEIVAWLTSTFGMAEDVALMLARRRR